MSESTPPEDSASETGPVPVPRREPSAGPVRLVVRQLLGQLAVVVAVAALIVVVFGAAGLGTSGDARSGGGSSVAPATTSAAVGTSSGTGSSSAPAPATTPPASTGAAPGPVISDSVAAAPRPKVDVLNEAAPAGTAAALAARLKAAGWRIGRVADFHGTVSATTVYYPSALRRAARELAKDMPGSPRVQPGFSTLAPTRLSVVVVG